MTDPAKKMQKVSPKRKMPMAPNMIAVASGKGGVGKTWFSVTLAHSLTQKGHKVLLFDGDLGLANVDIQLGFSPEYDLTQVIEGKLPLHRVIYQNDDTGFDIISGQSGAASLSLLPVQKVMGIRDSLIEIAKNYDYVVVDLGAGVERTVRILSQACKTLLVLTNEEPTALTDAYAYIKLTHMAGLAETVQVVVNQIPSKTAGDRIYKTLLKACQNFLKIRPPLAGMIRQDKKVGDSIRHQTPLLTRYPNCYAAMDVEAIADHLRHTITKA